MNYLLDSSADTFDADASPHLTSRNWLAVNRLYLTGRACCRVNCDDVKFPLAFNDDKTRNQNTGRVDVREYSVHRLPSCHYEYE